MEQPTLQNLKLALDYTREEMMKLFSDPQRNGGYKIVQSEEYNLAHSRWSKLKIVFDGMMKDFLENVDALENVV